MSDAPTMNDTTIIRVVHNQDYFVVSRHTAQDSKLSFEARGVLFYLLSKPNDWEISVANLMTEGDIGRDKTYKILRELTDAHYLIRDKKKDAKTGQWVWENYQLFERPYPDLPDTDSPYTANTEIKQNIDSLSNAHAQEITTTWQVAFEKHIGLATAQDVDFFADLLKNHDADDVTYAIVEASKNDPNIKNHAHRGIQQALDALERSRGVKVNAELQTGIKALIHGNGNHANVLRAAKALGTVENLTIFKAFWTEANPIGKPDQRPHASQVEAYLPQALEWHTKKKPAPTPDGVPTPQAKRTTTDCAECDPRYGNRGAIGNGFFEFAGTKYHCPFCWQGVYDHPTAMQGKIADLMRGVSK